MKPPDRKLTFQLTPLLDLLLIVIFAQYMEVRHETETTTKRAESRRQAAEQQLQQTEDQLAAVRALHGRDRERNAELQEQAESLQEQMQSLRQDTARLEQRSVELQESLKQARRQRDLVGQLVTELFHVPAEVVEQQFAPSAPGLPSRSAEEIAVLKEKFRELARQRPQDAVKHLLTYEELRKRCDIWDIYIAENGTITLSAGGRTFSFRSESAESFATKVYDFYKTLPEPKSLVIILLSYGNAKAVWRKAANDGLRDVAGRMRSDRNGQTSFEYAVLGYRPRVDPDGPNE